MSIEQAELFKVLGVESRIRIIELLKQNGPLTVTEISDNLNLTPSAISQHLKTLKYAGLVRSERKGYWIPYEIDAAALERCRSLLSEVCTCGCEGTGLVQEAEINNAEDKLALLRRHERELQKQLKEVQGHIERLDEKE